jgi:hypothetical protein
VEFPLPKTDIKFSKVITQKKEPYYRDTELPPNKFNHTYLISVASHCPPSQIYKYNKLCHLLNYNLYYDQALLHLSTITSHPEVSILYTHKRDIEWTVIYFAIYM